MNSYIPPEYKVYTYCIYCSARLPSSDKYFYDKKMRPCGHVFAKYFVACNKCYESNDFDNSDDIACIKCYNDKYHDKYIDYVEEPVDIKEIKEIKETEETDANELNFRVTIIRYYKKIYNDGYIKNCKDLIECENA